jgi:hypothetical protein
VTIELLPPLTRSGANWLRSDRREEALTVGPAYARTRGMSRWHRVRSGVAYLYDGQRRESYHFWCGQFANASTALASDMPDGGIPTCGTCEGRAEGFSPARPDLLFSPETLAQPRWCPSRRLYDLMGPNVGRCLACGQLAPVKVHGWNGVPKLQQHEPLTLVPGCPFHAWRSLVGAGDSAVCACRVPSPYAAEGGEAR